MTTVYVIGSLRNPRITEVGGVLRDAGYDVFDDWHAGGPQADDEWRRYENERGRTYKEALRAYNAQHIFHYDLYHLNRAHVAVLVHPAGRSAHLELGYIIGQGKPGFVLFDEEPVRWDVMNAFATSVCFSVEELLQEMGGPKSRITLNLNNTVEQQIREYRRAPWNADI
jgi:hypothetical protein